MNLIMLFLEGVEHYGTLDLKKKLLNAQSLVWCSVEYWKISGMEKLPVNGDLFCEISESFKDSLRVIHVIFWSSNLYSVVRWGWMICCDWQGPSTIEAKPRFYWKKNQYWLARAEKSTRINKWLGSLRWNLLGRVPSGQHTELGSSGKTRLHI